VRGKNVQEMSSGFALKDTTQGKFPLKINPSPKNKEGIAVFPCGCRKQIRRFLLCLGSVPPRTAQCRPRFFVPPYPAPFGKTMNYPKKRILTFCKIKNLASIYDLRCCAIF
jgi:hypothetical protein